MARMFEHMPVTTGLCEFRSQAEGGLRKGERREHQRAAETLEGRFGEKTEETPVSCQREDLDPLSAREHELSFVL